MVTAFRTAKLPALIVVAAALAACVTSTSSFVPAPSATASVAPTATPTQASVSPSSPPPATPLPAWTRPKRVIGYNGCTSPSLAIDPAGGLHIAATCERFIFYAGARMTSGSWGTSMVADLLDEWLDVDPQLAFEGDTEYLAFTRFVPDSEGSPVKKHDAVYFRTRTWNVRQSAESSEKQIVRWWEEPARLGLPGDILGQFRVDGTTLHATVLSDTDGPTYYERIVGVQVGDSFDRYLLPGVIGPTSMRIDSEGAARIVYRASESLEYAIASASGPSIAPIPGTGPCDWDPLLELDALGHAHVLWTRGASAHGCADGSGEATDGTYYATDSGGTWTVTKLTSDLGEKSLQVEGATGRIHAIVASLDGALNYYTGVPGTDIGPPERLPVEGGAGYILGRDPAAGALLVGYARVGITEAGVYILTKG